MWVLCLTGHLWLRAFWHFKIPQTMGISFNCLSHWHLTWFTKHYRSFSVSLLLCTVGVDHLSAKKGPPHVSDWSNWRESSVFNTNYRFIWIIPPPLQCNHTIQRIWLLHVASCLLLVVFVAVTVSAFLTIERLTFCSKKFQFNLKLQRKPFNPAHYQSLELTFIRKIHTY